jgi:hypothetical protein
MDEMAAAMIFGSEHQQERPAKPSEARVKNGTEPGAGTREVEAEILTCEKRSRCGGGQTAGLQSRPLPELYTNGHETLFRNRTRKTELPADAPPAYARSQLGARQLQWNAARGWLAGPRVTRMADHERAAAERRV